MEKSKVVAWLKKRKWDLVFYGVLAVILFVPSVRMPVVSTIQRVFAFSPSELSEDKQKEIQSFHWELETLDGDIVNFKESKGKVVLVNLWATWCPPCIAEMPSLQKLYDAYGDQVDFYFVTDDEPSTINRFLSKNNYTFPIHMAYSQPLREFTSRSLPTTYIVNKEGKIVIEEVGAHDWFASKFQEKLNELIAE